MLNKDLSNI